MSRVRHEYLDGQIPAMAGGSPEHAALAAAIVVVLGEKLRGGRCRPYSADLQLRVLATGLATYADASVVCGKPARDRDSPTHVTNASVVVEVLSPSTEEYDRGEKRTHYQQMESLREYVLISQDRRRIDVYCRNAKGRWELRTYAAGGTVELPSLRLKLSVDALYEAAGVDVS